jgi:phytoene dehydrogenase-like protein
LHFRLRPETLPAHVSNVKFWVVLGGIVDSYDAILIGSGHNALVASAYLARAGWSTLVLEQGERPGGAVASAALTRPGFVSDLFATNMNLFLGSPVFAELGGELERHGLEFAGCAHPFANVFPDGRALRVHQGAEETLAGLEAHDHGDAEGWRELDRLYERLSADQVYVVGDTPHDMEATNASGAVSVGVASGHYSVAELEAAGGAHVLRSLEDGFPGL